MRSIADAGATRAGGTANSFFVPPVQPSLRLPTLLRSGAAALRAWVDGAAPRTSDRDPDRVDAARIVPFVLLHVACALVLVVGWSPLALAVCAVLYLVRMLAVTGFYHRYFAHRAFRTSRPLQCVFALLGASAAQRGPLWWAAHHRKHHKHADTDCDVHSPARGFLWSHIGWFTTPRNFVTDLDQVRDFARYPELRFVDRFDMLAPALLGIALFVAGEIVAAVAPHANTSGLQLVVWGFCISTVLLFHATSTINSLGHLFGRRRYATRDHSRNSFLLALLTLGEGWHNNHHHYPIASRQGFFWWEVDVTWWVLRAMAALGLIWDLRPVPEHVRAGARGVR
jgi:stearoyl-CoA desaturase (delta-9 desaturase)